MFTIPKLLVEVLLAWKEVLIRKHIPHGPNDFVISNEYGGMVSIYSPTRWFKDYLGEHHFKDVKLHSLRHTFASLLLARGMDLCTVRDLMGHKDIETTEMYLHSFQMRKKDLMSTINSYIQAIVED
jgi:site-specific recombinase XerD